MKTIKILNNDIPTLLETEASSFPKYATQIINLANQNAQGTRPSVVGQMSELIQEFKGRKLKDWEDWYLEKHPEAIAVAARKVFEMVNNFKDVMTQIDQGIDGFIGDKPVSIKPASYELKKSLSEIIEAPILFYEKVKDGIKITFNEKLIE